jgi:hypothetical protein
MSKIDQYRRGLALCLTKAAEAPSGELRAIWQTIANSYAFLAELESTPGDTIRFVNGDDRPSPISGRRINRPPTDDHIPS